jgi:hypothetical protein
MRKIVGALGVLAAAGAAYLALVEWGTQYHRIAPPHFTPAPLGRPEDAGENGARGMFVPVDQMPPGVHYDPTTVLIVGGIVAARGKGPVLVADSARAADLAAVFNRSNNLQIIIDDPRARDSRVSGDYYALRPDRFAEGLAYLLGLHLTYRDSEHYREVHLSR